MSDEILIEVRPKFVSFVKLFSADSLMAFAIAPIILVVIMIVFAPNGLEGMSANQALMYVVIPELIIVALLLLIFLFIAKKNYEVTSYKVYSDRIEFEEGFINHKYTTIKIEDVKEIHLTQNFLQRMVNIATVRFVTSANNSTVSTGISFCDIENSNYVYAKLKQIQESKN